MASTLTLYVGLVEQPADNRAKTAIAVAGASQRKHFGFISWLVLVEPEKLKRQDRWPWKGRYRPGFTDGAAVGADDSAFFVASSPFSRASSSSSRAISASV